MQKSNDKKFSEMSYTFELSLGFETDKRTEKTLRIVRVYIYIYIYIYIYRVIHKSLRDFENALTAQQPR